MADEQEGRLSGWMRALLRVRGALWGLLDPTLHLGLLAAALAAAVSSPFLGMRWALCGLATAAVAVGFVLAHGAIGLQRIGGLVQQIQRQYDEEVQKAAAEPQRRAAPEPPLPSWEN